MPSPQSNSSRSPPRRTRSDGGAAEARSASSPTCPGRRGRDPRRKYGRLRRPRAGVDSIRAVSEAMPVDLALEDFREEHAATVLGWVRSADDALSWAEAPFLRVGPALFEEWHAQPGVVPCVGMLGGVHLRLRPGLGGSGRARGRDRSRDRGGPSCARQGVGRAFVLLLAAEARRRGFRVVLREDRPARTAPATPVSTRAGFSRLTRRGRGGAQPRRDRASTSGCAFGPGPERQVPGWTATGAGRGAVAVLGLEAGSTSCCPGSIVAPGRRLRFSISHTPSRGSPA